MCDLVHIKGINFQFFSQILPLSPSNLTSGPTGGRHRWLQDTKRNYTFIGSRGNDEVTNPLIKVMALHRSLAIIRLSLVDYVSHLHK